MAEIDSATADEQQPSGNAGGNDGGTEIPEHCLRHFSVDGSILRSVSGTYILRCGCEDHAGDDITESVSGVMACHLIPVMARGQNRDRLPSGDTGPIRYRLPEERQGNTEGES